MLQTSFVFFPEVLLICGHTVENDALHRRATAVCGRGTPYVLYNLWLDANPVALRQRSSRKPAR